LEKGNSEKISLLRVSKNEGKEMSRLRVTEEK